MMHMDILPKTLPAVAGEGPLRADDPAGWDMFEIGWQDFGSILGLHSPGDIRGFGAIGLGLAIQCADVKARDIAKVEMRLLRNKREAWNTVEAKDHWFAKFLAKAPNSVHSWGEFWRMTVLHLELAQNAYILIDADPYGNVQELIPIMPSRCRPRIGLDGQVYYEINAANDFERAQLGGYGTVILPARKVIHLRGRMWDGLMGLSNLVLGAPLFDLLNKISDFQTNLFGNDGRQPLVFETDQAFPNKDIGDTAFRRLKQQLREAATSARTSGAAILLEAGIKVKSIGSNSKDATTTDSFNQQVVRVCGLMMVPPHKIFHYDSVKYDNQASADIQYANDCLVPIALNIEEKFRNQLLDFDLKLWPEFDREMMLAGDVKSLTERVKTAVSLGIMTVDEGRQRFGLNPLGGDAGKVRLVPVNTAQVNDKGEVVNQPAAGQPNNTGTAATAPGTPAQGGAP